MPAQEPKDAPPSIAAKRLLPWLVAVGFFMESLDTTILNTAVPAIAHSLQVPPLDHRVGEMRGADHHRRDGAGIPQCQQLTQG